MKEGQQQDATKPKRALELGKEKFEQKFQTQQKI